VGPVPPGEQLAGPRPKRLREDEGGQAYTENEGPQVSSKLSLKPWSELKAGKAEQRSEWTGSRADPVTGLAEQQKASSPAPHQRTGREAEEQPLESSCPGRAS